MDWMEKQSSRRITGRVIGLVLLVAVIMLGIGFAMGRRSGSDRGLRDSFVEQVSADPLRFENIEYSRPYIAALENKVSAAEQIMADGGDLETVEAALDECYEKYYNYDTMYTVAYIRARQDVTDSFYAEELAWTEDNYPRVQQLMEELLYAAAASDKAQQLEEEYFWAGFTEDYADDSESVYREDIVALMQQEAALLGEYRALNSSPTIDTPDGEMDYYDYVADKYDDEYIDALMQYYEKYNGEFARIYIELVKVRSQMARELGYDSYEQMQYDYYFERDYTPEEAAGYVADIKEYMVPLYRAVMESDPYSSISYDLVSEKQLIGVLEQAARQVGGGIEEAFDFMYDHGFYDVRLSSTKASMSFQSYLNDYEAPFLFLNPEGDVEDILSLSHEFGHYVDAYVNYNASETIDVSECFSQGMEYLLLGYFDSAMDEETLDNIRRLKMLDTLDLYVQQASFAEFESRVYSCDPEELSAEMLNELSLELAKEYGYYDGVNEGYYAMSWSDISHFFEMPFYVISYPVSNDIAMQVYELEQADKGAGLEKYLEILDREYPGLIDTVEAGGLQSPFEPGRIEHVVDDLSARLLSDKLAA